MTTLRKLIHDFTDVRREHLVKIADKSIARAIVKGLIWDRLAIWRKYVVAVAICFSAILLWGAETAERFAKLLHGLGLR